MEKILLTQEGKDKLVAEYQELTEVVRPEVIRELTEARAQGDLSENADYDAAKKKQSEVEGRIAQIEAILNNHQIINEDTTNKSLVKIGTTVKIHDLMEDEEVTLTIVGTVEADPFQGRISFECPLAKAIIDHEEGDKVTVKSKIPYEVKILKILN